jgi:hypothetical protein
MLTDLECPHFQKWSPLLILRLPENSNDLAMMAHSNLILQTYEVSCLDLVGFLRDSYYICSSNSCQSGYSVLVGFNLWLILNIRRIFQF